ncbi:MAG TPA: Ig-like domain-containing protein [Candidatus Dormibacteraeota bacterium]|nr:Ig-like domain-containing protein [Candidatus Dormibacteraeota bacterium]
MNSRPTSHPDDRSPRKRRNVVLRRIVMGVAALGASGAAAVLVGGLHASAVTTLNVNSPADVDVVTSDTTCPATCTLREAIHVANNLGGSVQINVPAGTYGLALGELQIGTFPAGSAITGYDVTLQGAGSGVTTIQQNDNTNRVLHLDPTTQGNVAVDIAGVTITGGRDSFDGQGGAGVRSGSGTASALDATTISASVITGNQVSSGGSAAQGGGVQNIGGSLTVTNSTISNNASGSSDGGGVFFYSGYPVAGALTVSGSTFSANTLTNTTSMFRGGAALSLDGIAATHYVISDSRFIANVATGTSTGAVGGGAIYATNGDLQVRTSLFTGNHADGPVAANAGGGAVNVGSAGDGAANFFVRLNRIVGNAASNGPSGVYAAAAYDFSNNWWGCNSGPGFTGCDRATNGLTIPRLVLGATASPSTVVTGGMSTITASVRLNSSGQDTRSLYGGTVPDGPAVTFVGSALGSVLPASVSMSAGIASTTYTAGSTGGSDGVMASLDSAGYSAAITVQQAPAIVTAPSRAFTAGGSNSFQITATGYPTPVFSTSGTLPSGVSLSNGGLLSGIPAAGTGGVYGFTVTAGNGVLPNANQSFTLYVNESPSITSLSSSTFTARTAGSFTVTAQGYPPPTIALTVGALPSGVSFNSATHVLGGTPAAGTGGTYSLTFTASNGVLPNAGQSFTLTVNAAPAITSSLSATMAVGSWSQVHLTASGYPAPAFSSAGLPSWASLSPDGWLGATPPAGSGGVHTFGVTASNGISPADTETFTLTVGEAPSISSPSGTTFTAGTPGSFTVVVHGYPAPVVYEMGGNPGGVWFNSTTHVLSGVPMWATGGVYSISFTAYNISGSVTQPFTLTVDESPGIVSDASATFAVGAPGSFTVSTIGYPFAVISKDSTPLPDGVTLVDNHDGTATLAGTPAIATGGVYGFVVYATNGVGMDKSQAFTLTVDQGPAFVSVPTTTFTAGAAGTFTVEAGGLPSVTGIALTGGTLPDGVTYVDNGDGTGTLSGTPAGGTGGAHDLTFTATNGVPPDATQSFSLVIDEAPAITSAGSLTVTAGSLFEFTLTTTGFPAVTWVSQSGTLPAGVTFADNGNGTATLGGTAAGGTGGSFPVHFDAGNGIVPDAAQSFTLTVDEHPDITSAATATFVQGQSGSFTVTATGYPVPQLTELGALPGGVTFVDNGNGTGTLSGTPVSAGPYDLSFGAANGVEPPASQHFILSVQKAPSITSADHTTFQVGTLGSFTVTTAGYPAPAVSKTGALPSGVSLHDNGDGSATLSGTPPAGSSGAWPLTLTAHNGVGSDATQAFTLQVGASPTTTVVAATTTTPTFGQTATFTATVSTGGGSTPTGSVTFSVDGVAKTAMSLTSGHAAWATKGLQIGGHTVTAAYGGQTNVFQASSGTRGVTVAATQTITGTKKGDLSVTSGSVYITNAKVSGDVIVSGGASVTIANSTVGHGITATGAGMLTVCGVTTSTGGVTISGTTGFVLVGSGGDAADRPCAGNTVAGGLTLNANRGGFEMSGNTIKGTVTVNNNVLYGPAYDLDSPAPEIEANSIKGTLSCTGNVPAPTDDLQPNRVIGSHTGQCGAPGF